MLHYEEISMGNRKLEMHFLRTRQTSVLRKENKNGGPTSHHREAKKTTKKPQQKHKKNTKKTQKNRKKNTKKPQKNHNDTGDVKKEIFYW